MAESPERGAPGEAIFIRRVVIASLIVTAIVALALLVWHLLEVLILVFGAVLVAAILRAIGDPIARRTPLSKTWALPVAALILLAVIGLTAWLFHAQVSSQITGALSSARNALPALEAYFGVPGLADQASELLQRALSGGGLLGKVTSVGATVLEAVTNLLLILFGGVYLAADPKLYRNGVVQLLPERARDRVGDMLDTAGGALKLWLLGQFFAMIVTGTLTWLALWLLGLPSAAGLGLIAGVTEFIPLLGPFLGAVPALLIAFSQSLSMALWTAAAFVAIQQVESNMIQPLITRRAVSIPPALLLFAVVAFGVLFGIRGVLLAAPLTVVSFVAVKKLYVRDTLGEQTAIPGER